MYQKSNARNRTFILSLSNSDGIAVLVSLRLFYFIFFLTRVDSRVTGTVISAGSDGGRIKI